MKIEPTDKLQPLGRSAPAAPNKDTGQGKFATVFDKKIASTRSPSNGPVHALSPLATPPLQPLAEPVASDKANGLIDGLEHYQRLLADGKVSLRQLSPVVENLRRQAGDAQQMVSRMDAADPMRAILQETLLVINKEVERFNLGAYVAD